MSLAVLNLIVRRITGGRRRAVRQNLRLSRQFWRLRTVSLVATNTVVTIVATIILPTTKSVRFGVIGSIRVGLNASMLRWTKLACVLVSLSSLTFRMPSFLPHAVVVQLVLLNE